MGTLAPVGEAWLSQVGNSRVVGTALRLGRTRLHYSHIPILILFQFAVISGWTRWPIWHHPELPSFPRSHALSSRHDRPRPLCSVLVSLTLSSRTTTCRRLPPVCSAARQRRTPSPSLLREGLLFLDGPRESFPLSWPQEGRTERPNWPQVKTQGKAQPSQPSESLLRLWRLGFLFTAQLITNHKEQNSEVQPLLLTHFPLKAQSYTVQGHRIAEPLGTKESKLKVGCLFFPIFQTSRSEKTPDAITFH